MGEQTQSVNRNLVQDEEFKRLECWVHLAYHRSSNNDQIHICLFCQSSWQHRQLWLNPGNPQRLENQCNDIENQAFQAQSPEMPPKPSNGARSERSSIRRS